MGQQQLLLLVLGIVIVGIAVVAGIQAFSEGKTKAERDAAVSDAMRIISDVQAWKLKPTAFGGGSNADGFTGISFAAIGIDSLTSDGNYKTINGCYDLTAGDDAVIAIMDTSCATAGAIADVTISGTEVSNISWTYK